jgi:hypothetical protein
VLVGILSDRAGLMRGNTSMSDDDEMQRLTEIERITNGKPSYLNMDTAVCARMRAVIAAGLESAPIGVVTTPGTKNPKYVPAEPSPPLSSSSQRAMEHV